MRRGGIMLVTMAGGLAACASAPPAFDLRDRYLAAVPEARSMYLDCDGVSDKVCDCRRGGLSDEFDSPSRKSFDEGYAVLAAAIEDGASREEAEEKAVAAVFTDIRADVEDVCTYFEQEASTE
jgi:hypothetical protein